MLHDSNTSVKILHLVIHVTYLAVAAAATVPEQSKVLQVVLIVVNSNNSPPKLNI